MSDSFLVSSGAPTRAALTLAACFVACTTGALSPAPVASAAPAAVSHEGTGQIRVVDVRVDGEHVVLEVEVTYSLDGHPATPREIVAHFEGPQGQDLGPMSFDPAGEDGRYRLAVELPDAGEWKITVSTTFPPAELVETVEISSGADRAPLLPFAALGAGVVAAVLAALTLARGRRRSAPRAGP